MQPPIPDLPALMRVDPLLLTVAARPAADGAAVLRGAISPLSAACLAASDVLHRQATGGALLAGGPQLQRALESCAAELAGVGFALDKAAAGYDRAESVAIPVPRPWK